MEDRYEQMPDVVVNAIVRKIVHKWLCVSFEEMMAMGDRLHKKPIATNKDEEFIMAVFGVKNKET